MDLFLRASTVRLISYRDKNLVAEDNHATISQGSDGSAKNAIWSVEIIDGKDCIRLKSCFGTYLTATSMAFMPGGLSGKKVIQRWPSQSNSASEWEPVRDGMQVRLRSLWGCFLRPHSGLPPWRNSITHDVPCTAKMREKVLWNVEVVEKCPDRGIWRGGYPATAAAGGGQQNGRECSLKEVMLKERMQSVSDVRWLWYRKMFSPFSG
ncbi:uncharacterized protein LOC127248516 [Andrographis paniculata]|uniref:uncharacterized protein LOC127248516 n=1 Tax=Andrographis paniculata TaxID=175694 RepID=UPI0021E7FB4F|nr:uncharacterized protein LOC127248516 [Andrographis paniculata]